MDAGPDGFRDFVVARSPALARTAFLLTGDRGLAEDLLQEALTRVASRWSKLSTTGDPEPYVRKVLYHLAVDGWRRRRIREVLHSSPAVQVVTGADDAEHTTQRVALQGALAKLTPKQRAVLVLRFFEDLTEAQTRRHLALLGVDREVTDAARLAPPAGAVPHLDRRAAQRGGRPMSTDLRTLLRSLADEAPLLDNRIALADTAYTAGRRRRHLRHLEISGAAAVLVVCAVLATLFVGPKPIAAEYGTASGTRATGYPTHIGHQFPVLDVPRRPGPAAGLMLGDSTQWYLVSPTGHRWSIPSPGAGLNYRPILSDDGRMLGYPDAKGNFVVRDLVSGRSVLFGGFSPNGQPEGERYAIDYNLPGYFSPDGNNLALPGAVNSSIEGIVVLSLDTHRVSAWHQADYNGDFMAGWLDNGRLALVDRTKSPGLLDVRDTGGAKVDSTPLTGISPDQRGGYSGWDELTADRAAVDVVTGQSQDHGAVISRLDVHDGHLMATFTLPQPRGNCVRTGSAGEVVSSTWTDGLDVPVQATTLDGTTRTLTTVSRTVRPQCVELTSAAVAGAARSPMLLDRLSDLVVVQWKWWLAALAVLTVGWRLRLRQRLARPVTDG